MLVISRGAARHRSSVRFRPLLRRRLNYIPLLLYRFLSSTYSLVTTRLRLHTLRIHLLTCSIRYFARCNTIYLHESLRFRIYTLCYLRLHDSTTMASSAASTSAAPAGMSFELACCNWTMEKHSSVLEDELKEDALGHSVLSGSILADTARMVNAPVWLQRAYENINNDLQSMATVIQKLQDGL